MAGFISCGPVRDEGVTRLVEALKKLPDDYFIIANYKLTGRGSPLDLDVILLAPHAIYVIEDKNWSGEITGDHRGWYHHGKKHDDVLEAAEHKAKVLKSAFTEYCLDFRKISVQSCVSLSAKITPDIEGLEVARKEFVLGLNEVEAFVREPIQLEYSRDLTLPGRYQAMLRRAIVKGLRSPAGTEIRGRLESYRVERIAYPHNRYIPYLVSRHDEKIILKCYDLPMSPASSELEQFVSEHHKVVERYHDVLQHLQEEPRDDSACYIEIGGASFVDKRLYVVPTRWQSGSWELLPTRYAAMDLDTKLEVALRLCRGLDYAHTHGIVHRNLSPDCILVSDSGDVRIIDWDFAIFWDEENKRQVHGTTFLFKDSPEEMQADLWRYERFQAPELKENKASQDLSNQLAVNNLAYQLACPETDLYSLGVVLYELFSDREFTGALDDAKSVLLGERLMEEIVDNILTLCDLSPEKRKQEILPRLAELFDEQAGQKYLPRISRNYTWTVSDLQLTGASDRHETRMSVSYRMREIGPNGRSVIVKFLKTDLPEEGRAEQEDVQALLKAMDPRYTAAWIQGDSIAVAQDGKFNWNADPNTSRIRYYQIFEYIEGTRLDEAILKGEFSDPKVALRLSLQLLRAVQAVHEAGWVHFDIKPDNFILLPHWQEFLDNPDQPQPVKLIDFGSAHPIDRAPVRKSLSPGFKSVDAYDVSGVEKYQIDLNSAALVIAAMLCGLNPAPNYSPNLDLELLKEKAGEKVFGLLQIMTRPRQLEWNFKSVAQFAAELEKALQQDQPPKVEAITAPRDEQQAILQEYEAIRKYLQELYDEVMNPILTRLEKKGFDTVDAESSDFNDQAKDACRRAQVQIEDLERLKNAAIASVIDVGPVIHQLRQEWKLVDLKRRLAWAIDRKDDKELTSTIDEANAYLAERRENANEFIRKLLEQAHERRKALAADHKTVDSTEEKTNHLLDLASHLSDTEIPLTEISEIQDSFRKILETTQKFEMLGIQYAIDERTVDSYRKLATTVEQREKIDKSALVAIEEFEKKARANRNSSPQVSHHWFSVIPLLRIFLGEKEHEAALKRWDDLQSEIEHNCAQWEKAHVLLQEAKQQRENPVNGKNSYWDACLLLGQAFIAYSEHSGIEDELKACVEAICDRIRLDMSGAQKSRVAEFPKVEVGLIADDWRDGRLVNFDLPRWLVKQQQQIQQDGIKAERLADEFRKMFGNELFSQQEKSILPATQKVVADSLEIQHWVDGQIAKRREIRTAVQQFQTQAKTNVKKTQTDYDDFCAQHPNWAGDPEVKEVELLIAGQLDRPELVNRARLSFAREDWKTCIDYCQKDQKTANRRVPLPEGVNDEYRFRYLSETSAEIPGEGYDHFILILKQLAIIYQAGNELLSIWTRQDHEEASYWLEQIETYGAGQSPLVEAEKQRIAFDEKKKEYQERERYGAENFAAQSTLNGLAEKYRTDFEAQVAVPAASRAWIQGARDLLVKLLEFDPGRQSLWVGKRKLWLDELSTKFLAQVTIWIVTLQTQPRDVEANLDLALSCLRTTRRVGRLRNLDSQQRRWVVRKYYEMQASQAGESLEKIVSIWREAVSELSDDTVILEKFKKARLACWIAMLDAALTQLADDANADQDFQKLLQRDESAAPLLFAPIVDADSNSISIPCDETKEIELRRQLGQQMMDAEEELSRDSSRLPVVMRELKNAAREPGRIILESKADAVASRFVEAKIHEGDAYLVGPARDLALAGKCYVDAFELAPGSEPCKDLIQENANAVRQYWQRLKQQIDELDVREGLIQSQLSRANELELGLQGVEKVHKITRLPSAEIKAERQNLDVKRNTLEAGKRLLVQYFSPASEEWQKAVRPSGNNDSNANTWAQLRRHHAKLEKEFGNGHEQVARIRADMAMFQPAVRTLYVDYKSIADLLDAEEDDTGLGRLLEICREVNNAARNLSVWEPEHHIQWMTWEGPRAYPAYYPGEFTAFEKWNFKFTGSEQPREYPYWQDSERFRGWLGWLSEFVKLQQPAYRFDQDKWQKFWDNQADVEPCLRSDHEAKLLFLGGFLMLARRTSEKWNEISEDALSKKHHYTGLYESLKTQNLTWLTREYKRVVLGHLCSWVADLERQVNTLCLTRQSQDEKRNVKEILKFARGLSASLQEEVEELDDREEQALADFGKQFDYDAALTISVSDAQKQVLRELKLFTDEERFSPAVLTSAAALNISFVHVDIRYPAEVQPRNVFYSYSFELARDVQ